MTKPTPPTLRMAARLQIQLDQKRGLDTPDIIRKLAQVPDVTDEDMQELREAISVR